MKLTITADKHSCQGQAFANRGKPILDRDKVKTTNLPNQNPVNETCAKWAARLSEGKEKKLIGNSYIVNLVTEELKSITTIFKKIL